MTSSKKKVDKSQIVFVDARKLGQGLKATFEGVAMVFDALGADVELPDVEKLAVSAKEADPEEEKAHRTENDARYVASPADVPSVEQPAEVKTEKAEQPEKVESEQAREAADSEVAVETAKEDPAETRKEPVEESVKVPTITADDVTRVIVQKIKQDRSNNAKIGQILKTYGVAKVGELPASRYEAFLTDLAAL